MPKFSKLDILPRNQVIWKFFVNMQLNAHITRHNQKIVVTALKHL
jgi:hypothetical protein